MDETPDEIAVMQRLIDDSFAKAGEHLLGIMRPQYALSAVQTVRYLHGIRQLALGTVTPSGEPRVSPVDGVFYRGRFHGSSDASAWKIRHMRIRTAVSAAHFVGDDLAIVVHGRSELIEPQHQDWHDLGALWRTIYKSTPEDWTPDPVYFRIHPGTMLTYCRAPEKFPELQPAS